MPAAAQHRHHLVVVGASAGGVQALRDLVAALPEDFPAAVVVVLHIAPAGTSVLPQILTRAGTLRAETAQDGAALQGGRIYVAPPNAHVTVEQGHLRLDRGPTVNGHRPAIDPLFQSAATVHGDRVAGVVLSGVLDDGTAGLAAIKDAGGLTLVQDPAEALYGGMPSAAIEFVGPDLIARAADLGRALTEVAAPPPDDPEPAQGDERHEFLEVDRGSSNHPQGGVPSGFSCPACNGVIWQDTENGRDVFRCRTGHAFTAETLLASRDAEAEHALWTALRALEERAALQRQLAERLRRRGSRTTAERFARRAEGTVQHAMRLRELLSQELEIEELEAAS
jgi:two-component system, chemotaxis family, protein-glutamate methylesterase/glutaminase